MEDLISVFISLVALIVSIIALVYTAETYWLKLGARIRGNYSICSSVYCDDKYICNLILENTKDRSIAIYKIYIRLGYSIYIEVENFEDDPLILQPFEVYRKNYDPIDLYSEGTRKVDLNKFFDDKSVKQRIVLSTSEGKYTIKQNLNYWDPIADFFRNYSTGIIRPLRSTHKGKSYGSNAIYIVEFKWENNREEIVPIYPRDHELRKFTRFNLTKESLESKTALEEYLIEKLVEGKIHCSDIVVYDIESWHQEIYKDQLENAISIPRQGWFSYYIVSRIYTLIENNRSRRINKSANKKRTK